MKINEKITREVLKEIVQEAIKGASDDIYRKIMLNANENSFYSEIAKNLEKALEKKELSMYFVDTNYNRAAGSDVGKGVGVYDKNKKTVVTLGNNQFDIIVHMNGRGYITYPENLIHLEVKKYNNSCDREKDRERLLSTTMFPKDVSTYCLGLIINTDIFESFYNAYIGERLFAERAEQIGNCIGEIEKSNRKIFSQYQIDYSQTDVWFSNIIAGYQLGAFVDIFPENVKITYYYSGAEWKQELISYNFS